MKTVFGWVVGSLVALVQVVAAADMTPAAILQQAAKGAAEMPAVTAKAEPAQPPTPAPSGLVAMWGTLEKPAELPGPAEVLSSYSWNHGLIHRHHYTTLVVKVAPGAAAAFKNAGFAPLEQAQVRLRWSRVSDVNGWGTAVNGEIHRAWKDDRSFSGAELDQAFALIADFSTDPLALLARDERGNAYIRQPAGTLSGWPGYLERCFDVAGSIEVRTGHSWTEDEKVLFEKGFQSGCWTR